MSKKRTLVVGDIHSGVRALEQLLLRAEVSVEDELIFLGDYVDGWSTAVETIDFLLKLNETQKCIFIRGNHDELCYGWLTEGKDNPMWHKHGGGATKTSYADASAETIDEHLKFYRNLKNYHIDESNRLFLHAGFTNLKGVEYEYFKKTFYWDRTLWELVQALNPELTSDDARFPMRLKHYKEIYIGHTPISKIDSEIFPGNEANVWNLDTGAAFKGPLSMMNIDTKEVWQSDSVQSLYPEETGRN